ncbi:MAG TPA: MupA/Atu3671 family FMN-dependent luciferase-like monooxygenase [Herpetosiphonaceae bacterium]
MPDYQDETGIAIIGMAGAFPGAKTLEQFWDNLRSGVESIAQLSDAELLARGADPVALQDPRYVKAAAMLDGIEEFDATFFGMTRREAEITDPQQRIFLERAWEALEHAGYNPERFPGTIGVYGGGSTNTYLLFNLLARPDLLQSFDPVQIDITNAGDHLTTRVSYKLNLRGPSHLIQSACSTSLVAVHVACQGLLNYECDLALAGGVSINAQQRLGYQYLEGGIVSPDGHCRAFDASAQGTIFGSGVGIVVLKRMADALADGDTIHAVIRGSAINNDGALKVGYTAPSVHGQAEVISEALSFANLDPTTISYIEAHGTGTALGDPIEIQALTKAFRATTDASGFCAVGSVKSNIGHLGAAAGVASLIKAVQALKHREMPPTLHVTQPNPAIDWAGSPFYVNTRLQPWPAGDAPRRAGISSFGVGGTNAHVILEEAPAQEPTSPSRPWQVLVISAKTPGALELATENLSQYFRQQPAADLADIAYTLQLGRTSFPYRGMLVCRDSADALATLERLDPQRVFRAFEERSDRPVIFLLPGQGAQYVNMGRELYEHEPVFRAALDRCCDLLLPHLGRDLRRLLYPTPADAASTAQQIDQTQITQPALFVVAYALAQLWIAWGVQPAAMVGHSIGEYVAATLAGVFRLEDALALVAARGRLMQALPPGAMLAVPLPAPAVQPWLGRDLALAAINGPAQCVVSGPTEAVAALEAQLRAQGSDVRRLPTSHAFHSAMLDPMLDAFTAEVSRVGLAAPLIPFVSNVTGAWITAEEATSPRYWAHHLRQTVRFGDGLHTVLQEPDAIVLEVGPGQALSRLARRHPAYSRKHTALPSLPSAREQESDLAFMLTTLGKLWLGGAAVDWAGLYKDERRRRVSLPTYPFERQRYWIEPLPGTAQMPKIAVECAPAALPTQEEQPEPTPVAIRPDIATAYVAPRNEIEQRVAAIWQEMLGIEHLGVYDNFFELGGHSLLGLQVISQLRDAFQIDLPLEAFFQQPTVAGLAEAIAAEQPEPEELDEIARILAEVEGLELDQLSAELMAVWITEPAELAAPPAPVVHEFVELPSAPILPIEPPRVTTNGRRALLPPSVEQPMQFSLCYFSSDEAVLTDDKYRLLLEGAKLADQYGLTAIWTPERHFHHFGGLYPNPATLGAALAVATERVQIRAGSVVLPLHHPIRIAEEWSLVDNLSKGRTGVAFASGWHADDFVFFPEHYAERKKLTVEGIRTIRQLWRGEPILVRGGGGNEIPVRLFPRPIQPTLPMWLTAANSPETFVRAGELGLNVLTSVVELTLEQLEERIALYRATLAEHGHDPQQGHVTVMLHTFIGEDDDEVKEIVREPFSNYLRTHGSLLRNLARSLNLKINLDNISAADERTLVGFAFERYFEQASLFGTPEKCIPIIDRLQAIGANEIACLIDFGVATDTVLASLRHLNDLRGYYAIRAKASALAMLS